ncbi:MAG: ATP-binding cassette domain-containing protein, partial [Bacteroidota bacterium]
MSSPLLTVTKLSIAFLDAPPVVKDLSFSLHPGERMGFLGLSGSGKSLTALALLGLLPSGATITSGTATYYPEEGEAVDLFSLTGNQWQEIRGKEIGLIFQEPLTALNPTHRIESQLMEAIDQFRPALTTTQARKDYLTTWLNRVELAEADHERILAAYPHELSGGQRQRLLIALSLLAEPRFLIADEPTTALDTITEAAILQLLDRLRKAMNMGLLFITHDLTVIERITDRALVLQNGNLIHQGSTAEILALPNAGLGGGLTSIDTDENTSQDLTNNSSLKVLEVEKLSISYPSRKTWPWSKPANFPVVRDISFTINAGEWVALVGPSGCGKTTTARHLAGLVSADTGTVTTSGERPQLVFQDPSSSLNPSHSLRTILTEVLRNQGGAIKLQHKSNELLAAVGLPPETYAKRFPHQLSGGQRQRV